MADIDKALERLEQIVEGFKRRGPFGIETRALMEDPMDPEVRIRKLEEALVELDKIVRELLARDKS